MDEGGDNVDLRAEATTTRVNRCLASDLNQN